MEKLPIQKIEIDKERASFDEQYDHPETILVGNETFKVYRAYPDKKKTESTILFGHGWPSNPKLMKENIYQLYNKGRKVFLSIYGAWYGSK